MHLFALILHNIYFRLQSLKQHQWYEVSKTKSENLNSIGFPDIQQSNWDFFFTYCTAMEVVKNTMKVSEINILKKTEFMQFLY